MPLEILLLIETSSLQYGDHDAARGRSEDEKGQAPSTYKCARF
jgi:hypothetical protein